MREVLGFDDEALTRLIEERRARPDYATARCFGALLKAARRRRSLTLHDVSIESGVSPRLVWLAEEGALSAASLPADALDAVAEVLEIDIDDLCTRAEGIADFPPSGPGELVAEIPASRDGLWLHSTRLPVRLAADGIELVIGPAPELAYSRILVAEDGENYHAGTTYLPNSGQLRLSLPDADGPLLIYLD